MHYGLKHILYPDAVFGRNERRILSLDPYHILDLFYHPLRLRTGKIDLVDHREYVQIMIECQVDIGKCLCLYSLGCVYNKYRAVACGKRSAHLVVKVHMTGGVDEVKDILLTILCFIDRADSLGFDGDPSLPLKIHIVEHLLLHLAACEKPRLFDDPVCKCRLSVIDMCYYTKISYLTLIHT